MTITPDRPGTAETFQLSGQQLSNMLDSITDGFIAFDLEWRFTFVNRVAADMLAAPAEKLIGRRLWDIFPEFSATGFGEACRRAVAEGLPTEHEDYYPPRHKWFAIRVYPSDVGASVYILDITERKKTNEALRQIVRHNSQLATAIASTTTGVIISDPNLPDNPIVFSNPAFTAITGYTSEEAYGRNCRFLQGPDTDPSVLHQIRNAIAERRPFRGRLRNYRKDGVPFWNELTINPAHDSDGNLIAFVGLQTDETARVQAEQALQASEERLHNQNKILEERVHERTQELENAQIELEQAYNATLEAWSLLLDLRDNDTEGHSQRVTAMSLRLARALGLSASELVHIQRGALLHDIGKMGVPDAILHKPGPLDDEEWSVMRKHPVYAYETLSGIPFLSQALDIPHYHHEKWDGTGYPCGLKAEQIPLAARIFAIVDIWDALRSDRPYRKGWPEERVRQHIRELAGAHLDPHIVEIFLKLPIES